MPDRAPVGGGNTSADRGPGPAHVLVESNVVVTVIFAALMLAALCWDVVTRRIPNGLVATTFTVALVLRYVAGWGAVGAGLLGACLALLILMPLFALRAMGGGDVKLFVAVGAFLGPAGFVAALLASAIAGGVLGLAIAIRKGVLLPVLHGSKDLAVHGLTLGRAGARPTLDAPGAITVPYGAAIAIGSTAAWLMLGGIAPW